MCHYFRLFIALYLYLYLGTLLSSFIIIKKDKLEQVTSQGTDGCVEDFHANIKDFSFMQVSQGNILVKYSGEDSTVSVPICYQNALTWNIGREAFKKNTIIEKVILPPNVSEIDYGAFSECSNLENIEAPGVEIIKVSSFERSGIKYPLLTNVKDIGERAFMECRQLKSIDLPNVTHVRADAFRGSAIENISLPQAEEVANSAFVECQNLQQIELPNVRYLGERAFISSAITTISLPEVNVINIGTFVNCNALKNVQLPKVTHVQRDAFRGSGLQQITLPNVRTIGENAFGSCTFLKQVDFPNVDSIQTLAFNNTAIKNIHLPASVIEKGAFSGCTQLMKIQLPNVTDLKKGVFINCTQLQKVHLGAKIQHLGLGIFFCTPNCDRKDFELRIDAEDPPLFEAGHSKNPLGFSEEEINTLLIKVPESAVKIYQNAAGWKEYAHRIFAQSK